MTLPIAVDGIAPPTSPVLTTGSWRKLRAGGTPPPPHTYHDVVDLAEFVAQYPPAPPVERPNDPDDARRLLEHADGVRYLPSCATQMPPSAQPGSADGRHLWVIVPEGVPVILETAPHVRPPPLSLGVAKHTNLTGRAPASCGGEVWVDDADASLLYMTGGSGRFEAQSRTQLDDVARVFESLGFLVYSAGWSDDNDRPERVFR